MIMASSQRGLTLIELIISMVIIGIALTGVLSVMNLTVSRSADPMIQHQALAIAEAYLEEILTKEYNTSNCPAGSGSSRDTYCAVEHYHNLPDNLVRDQTGLPITALSAYNIQVSVGPAANWEGVNAKLVTVTASHPSSGISISLSGYRADY